MESTPTNAMNWLAEQPDTIFIGQNICYPSHKLYNSVKDIPANKKIEMPVTEELQMGISIGLALEGYYVISIYPRMDFLLLAMNQLINHLDKIDYLTQGNVKNLPILIRTTIGSKEPLNAGMQHTQDLRKALDCMATTINIRTVDCNYLDFYKDMYNMELPTIVVEL